MSTACSVEECPTPPWFMIPDPECDGCGRVVCTSHAALLDVDANGRPMGDNPRGAATKARTEWLCLACQELRLRRCVHGHDLAVVGVYRNGKGTTCRACVGIGKAS